MRLNLNMLEELIEVLTCSPAADPQLPYCIARRDGHLCAGVT